MKKIAVALIAATFAMSSVAYARDTIRIVGSSTVYPFTTTVAEQFGKKTGVKTPIVESTGTGGGFKLFCAGTGENHPDVSNASRAIKKVEIDECTKNGVTFTEVKIGFDAIVFATSVNNADVNITTKEIYLALAKWIIIDGKFVDNPHKNWNQINSTLPNTTIEVLGPPPTSGTRDSFVELVMEKECKAAIKEAGLEVTEDEEKKYCKSMREDGAFVEAGENDNMIVAKIQANSNAFGIFGYSFLEENRSVIKGATINDIVPNFESIQEGNYPIARPLFVYFKNEHFDVIPKLREFMKEFQSDSAIGPEGYLTEKGLISLK